MTYDIKKMYDSLNKEYTNESLLKFSQDFNDNFNELEYGNTKFGYYIPNLFFNILEPNQFVPISKRILEEQEIPNFNFGTLLFRLSLEINSDKTRFEKEILYSLILNLISKSDSNFNDSVHYSLGFVSSQAANIGIDISSSLCFMTKILPKHAAYFEEGFIDGLSNTYTHLLENQKLFKLFASNYEKWGEDSKSLLQKMYVDFIPGTTLEKKSNPINSQTFFWMNNFFSNESLKEYIKNYCEKSFHSQMEPFQVSSNLEKTLFNLQNDLKIEKNNSQKLSKFIDIVCSNFEGLKGINPTEEISINILNQIIKNQNSYIQELEQYKIDNERHKKLKDGIKKVL